MSKFLFNKKINQIFLLLIIYLFLFSSNFTKFYFIAVHFKVLLRKINENKLDLIKIIKIRQMRINFDELKSK